MNQDKLELITFDVDDPCGGEFLSFGEAGREFDSMLRLVGQLEEGRDGAAKARTSVLLDESSYSPIGVPSRVSPLFPVFSCSFEDATGRDGSGKSLPSPLSRGAILKFRLLRLRPVLGAFVSSHTFVRFIGQPVGGVGASSPLSKST